MLDNFIEGLSMEVGDSVYEVHIEYDKNESSAEAFKKASNFLEAIDELNNSIAQSFSGNIVTNAVIEKIEDGSFRIWLIDKIKEMPDGRLREYAKDPRSLLGDLLVASKKATIWVLSKKSELSNQEKASKAIEAIEDKISNSEIKNIGYKVDKEKILKAISSISKASSDLISPPTITIDAEDYEIDSPYVYDPNDLPEIERHSSITRSIFKIKKPDLVGDSKWTIMYDKAIDVKILDEDWLKRMRNREVSIFSGDSLDATLRIETYFNNDTLQISEAHYFIDKVFGVVPPMQKKILQLPSLDR